MFSGSPLTHEGEYKIKYERDKHVFSILGSTKKAEIETECEPKHWSSNGRVVKFKTKTSSVSKPVVPEIPAAKPEDAPSWCNRLTSAFDLSQEFETKLSFQKYFWHTMKFWWDKALIPKVAFTNMVDYKSVLFGINYNFNWDMNHKTDLFEALVGCKCKKDNVVYAKHSTRSFKFPGKVGFGAYGKNSLSSKCDFIGKDKKVIEKDCKISTETAIECGFDLETKNFDGRIGIKMSDGKKYTMQLMMNHALKVSSSFSFVPKKGFKFIWSDEIDTKKLCCAPHEGLGYNYGFTLEISPSVGDV